MRLLLDCKSNFRAFSVVAAVSVQFFLSIAHSQSCLASNSQAAKGLQFSVAPGRSTVQKLTPAKPATEKSVRPKSVPQKPVLAKPTAPKAELRPIMDKWAVVIGIDKFQNSTIPQLQYPSKDARDFAKFLVDKANFAADHVLLLTNEQATLSKIKEAIGDNWLPQRARKDDLVLVFASTHGSPKEIDVAGDNFLVVYDTDPAKLFSTGIRFADLAPTVKERTKCDRIVLLLDACSSGAANVGGKGMVRVGNFDVAALAGEGQIVVSSSAANQRSFESMRYENGVFTKQLMAALLSKGSNTTLTEAFSDLKERVEGEVQFDRKQTQTPVMRSLWKGGELILTAVPARPRQILPALTPSSVGSTLSANLRDVSSRGKQLYYSNKFDEALAPLTEAAQAGNAEAQFCLGYMYLFGKGVAPNEAKAFELFQKSADQGNADAQCNLGFIYYLGKVVPQSKNRAFEMFKKAAEQGNLDGLYNLGVMYKVGDGVPRNDAKAFELFQKASERGHAAAQCRLGSCYRTGEGVEKSETKAIDWYQKAANRGNAFAQRWLGVMYENGEGVPPNKFKAMEWYCKSANQGNADAVKDLERLERLEH